MKLPATLGLIVALLAAGCGAAPSSGGSPSGGSPSGNPSRDPSEALYVENRGGPDLVLVVGAALEVQVPCGAHLKLSPGDPGLSDLPWSLEARLVGSGEVVLTEEVTELPTWLVQLGTDELGLTTTAVLGPTVTCPPRS
jgi:hypothetical protein